MTDPWLLAGQTHGVNFKLKSTIIELPGQVVEGEKALLVPRDNTVSNQRLTFEAVQTNSTDSYMDVVHLQVGVTHQNSIRGGRPGARMTAFLY